MTAKDKPDSGKPDSGKDPYLDELESLDGLEEPTNVDIPLPDVTPEESKASTQEPKQVAVGGLVAGKKDKKLDPTKPKKGVEEFAADIPLQVSAVLGSREISLYELAALKSGEVVELTGAPNQVVDLMVNGRVIAKGELVEIDGKLGVRVLKIL